MVILGIDPGKDGAVALLSDSNNEVIDTPMLSPGKGKRAYDEPEMLRYLTSYQAFAEGHGGLVAVLEQVHAMPGQGVTSMFSMGEGYGLWRGLFVGLGIPYQLVTPQAWKKLVLAGFGLKDKNASYQVASRLYPSMNLMGARGGIKDGRSDAVCLAEWGRRTLNGAT
jgi:crossover junction endodeoxyribonuclease RuvC